MTTWHLEPVDDAHHDIAASAFQAAFHNDPLIGFLCQDASRHHQLTSFVFPTQVRLALPKGRVFAVMTPSGEVAGAICCEGPGRPAPSARTAFRVIPHALVRGGRLLQSMPSMLQGLGYVSATLRLKPKRPHWYIAILGVVPAFQGRGVARALIEQAIALAETDEVDLYLETTTAANVGLYGHFGFELIGSERPYLSGPPIWALRRPHRRS